MPYQDSPGWERQWKNFSWDWDFQVSTVSEGHRGANDKDKSDAKTKGAKLTFGEVLDCGVSRMLNNLGANHKTKFHDLGMGPGKMLIQSYLQYENLRCCMGVELAKGRYDLGERNVKTLLKTGWRGRKFLGIEVKKGEFLKIVEDVANKTPVNGWNVGDKVIAYYPLFRKDKNMIKNYNGTIVEIKQNPNTPNDINKNTYSIKYDDGTKADRVANRYLFIPGTERTLEVWYGSLFDYPGGFDAEICVLETDFPEEMHPHLIECMTSTPIGCTFLTYHDLKKFDCFDWNGLRQIDCNIYDNDRYITSWSQGWRFYIWEHIEHFTKTPIYKTIQDVNELKENDQIIFNDKNNKDQLEYGEIISISFDEDKKEKDIEFIVKTNKIQLKKVLHENKTISSSAFNIYRSRHRFRINDRISCYLTSNLSADKFEYRYQIYRGVIIAVNTNASYVVKYSDSGSTVLSLSEQYIYKLPKLLFSPGDSVMSCWPRNAQNKNCPHRYKRFPAQVISINNDSTYRLKFNVSKYLLSLLKPSSYPADYNLSEQDKKQSKYAPTLDNDSAESVREMWIQLPAKFVIDEIKEIEHTIGGVDAAYSSVNYQNIGEWNNDDIKLWLNGCGLENKIKNQTLFNIQNILTLKSENYKDLEIELNTLMNEKLNLTRIELRNLLSNINYLKQTFIALKQQANNKNNPNSQKDLAQLQQVWQNFRAEMNSGGSGSGGGGNQNANYEDTDSK